MPTASERDDIEQICVKYTTTREPALRDEIVEKHQWLVTLCARQMRRRHEPLDDLVQVANMGLLQAIERFDPSFGVTFRTFASATIAGMLRRHYRTVWRLRVPRRIQELHVAVSYAIDALTTELERSPTISEVARRIDVSEEDVLEAMDAGANFWPRSLDCGESDVGQPVQDDLLEGAERRFDIRELLSRLPPRARRVLYLRFFHELTQMEIAHELGISQVQVSRIMRSALLNLRGSYPTGENR